MKTYRGERTERGCEVTVDGQPLQRRSDLSGSACGALDWGFIGTGQLSLALLSDFLGDDPKAKAMSRAFDKKVIAELPHRSWTLTGQDLTNALAPLVADEGAIPLVDIHADEIPAKGTAFGDMPVETAPVKTIPAVTAPLPDAAKSTSRGQSAPLLKQNSKSPAERATDLKSDVVSAAAGEVVNAAAHVAAAAKAVGNAAYQVAHVCHGPADEPMSTANRAADQKADATNKAVDAAAALAKSAAAEANRVVAKLQTKPA